MRRLPVLALLALAAASTGCGRTATAQQVRKASDGGTILVGNGSGAPAAMRQAVSTIEQHCSGALRAPIARGADRHLRRAGALALPPGRQGQEQPSSTGPAGVASYRHDPMQAPRQPSPAHSPR